MYSVTTAAKPGSYASERVVLLPGAFDAPEQFLAAGFDAAVRERALPLDLQFVALELAHATDRSIIDRLHRTVILPARRAGCRRLWLGGISLGGFLALASATRWAADLDGLCLLAPYLGSHLVTREIMAAGSLARWAAAPPVASAANAVTDEDHDIWRFIAAGCAGLPVWLGLGGQDRFADRHRLLAAALPPAAVHTVSGGHDWPTWRQLWDNFLDLWTSPTLAGADAGSPRRC